MSQRKIKINFLDYWPDFYTNEINNCLITRILRKHYDIEICNDADYVFFSVMGENHWNVSDNCIKIFQTGENLVPDFNACDYGIGFEWMIYEDRYIRFPNYLFYDTKMLHKMEHKHELPEGWDIREEKPDFCSFMVSNPRNEKRNEAFKQLCQYKRVDSGGGYLNNIGKQIEDKLKFDSSHRFSLCFENGTHNGYTTEKIVQAFAARTIPIYWGDPQIGKVFNKDAMIDANSFESMETLIKRINDIEENPRLYEQILRTPALLPEVPSIDEQILAFENWLLNIFEQPINKAYRRNREMHGKWYVEKRLQLNKSETHQVNQREITDRIKNFTKRLVSKLSKT